MNKSRAEQSEAPSLGPTAVAEIMATAKFIRSRRLEIPCSILIQAHLPLIHLAEACSLFLEPITATGTIGHLLKLLSSRPALQALLELLELSPHEWDRVETAKIETQVTIIGNGSRR